MGLSAVWWWRGAALVLALATGVGVALWRAPSTVDVPAAPGPSGAAPGASGPGLGRPIPAPPALAQAGPPPGVTAGQWASLQRELADRPDELVRLAGYFGFADAVQRFRAGPAPDRRQLASRIDAGLDERLRQRELSAGEARLLKVAVLQELLPDEPSRQAALARWEADHASAAPALGAGEAEFLQRQAAAVAAWRAQPVAQRDPKALERDLEALRRSSFMSTESGGSR
jgi:hypothetical protein